MPGLEKIVSVTTRAAPGTGPPESGRTVAASGTAGSRGTAPLRGPRPGARRTGPATQEMSTDRAAARALVRHPTLSQSAGGTHLAAAPRGQLAPPLAAPLPLRRCVRAPAAQP